MKIKLTNKALIPLFLIVALALAWLAFGNWQKKIGSEVVIRQNGKIVKQLNLSKISEPCRLELEGNTILAERDGVFMINADCPDKLCIKQGKIKNGKGAIICLPNKVIIEFVSSDDAVDAVTGAR